MKRTKFFNVLVIGLAVTCVVAGCKKKPASITPLPGMAHKPPEGPGPGEIIEPKKSPGEGPSGIAQMDERGHVGWNEDTKMFEADTVYFDFDSATIKASEKSKIEKVADYLKSNSGHAAKIEGHCD